MLGNRQYDGATVAGVKHTLHQVRGSLYGAGMVTLALSQTNVSTDR